MDVQTDRYKLGEDPAKHEAAVKECDDNLSAGASLCSSLKYIKV